MPEVKEGITVGRTLYRTGESLTIGIATAGGVRIVGYDEIVLVLGAGACMTIAYTAIGLAARMYLNGGSHVASTSRRRRR